MEYFIYLPDLRVLGCRSCKTTIIGCRIESHLRAPPHKLLKAQIKPVQQWAATLDIIHEEDRIRDIPFLPDDSMPIEALGKPKAGGFRCTFTTSCRFVGPILKRNRHHLREVHNWDEKLKAGRRSAAQAEEEQANAPWRSGVFYQQLFAKGPRSENFEVARGQDLDALRAEAQGVEANIQQALEAFQSKAKHIRKQEAEDIEEQGDFASPNAWLRRLGASTHLKEFSGKKEFLRGLISLKYTIDPGNPEGDDDTELQQIHFAVKRLIRRAMAATKPSVVSWNVLFEVNRKELDKERSTPFHFRFKRVTRKRYITVCLQLFAYVVRSMAFEDPADRPPFKLSKRQSAAYSAMMQHADELTDILQEKDGNLKATQVAEVQTLLEEAVLELYISILDHFTKTTEYQSVLVSFLMVLSIRKDDTWETYSNFTPKLSAVMAISRLLLVKYVVDKRVKSIQRKRQRGQSKEDAEENSPSHFELISDMTRRFMVGGGKGWDTTPTQFIIRLRNYGMAADGNKAMEGSVSWDRDDAIYKGLRINVLGVQSMLHTALRRAESLLYKKLLFCRDFKDQSPAALGLPEIPWDDLIDNAADATIGHSFVESLFQLDPTSKGWLFRKMWKDDKLRREWVRSDSESGFELHEKAVLRYGTDLEEFLEVLLFLIHLCGGQPARALELLTLRHRNTVNGGVRNILIDRGLIMLVAGYHKGFSKTERLKIIHRFIPREVSILLVYYLWLALPHWEEAQANVWDVDQFSASLWATEETLDDKVSDGEDGYGSDTGETRSESGPSREPLQGAHRLGPGQHWTSPRMTRILRRMSRPGCDKGVTISSWRHLAIAFTRRYFRTATTAHATLIGEADEGYGSESDNEGDEDSPWDIQAGHGSLIAGLVYGRLITEGCFETNERRVNFRFISQEWHRLLGFPSAVDGFGEVLKPGRKRKNPSLHYEAMQELQLRRWKILRRINIDRELCRLYGDQTRFRGKQREAVESIMMNKSPIVVVMGTGTGKSLCFMLPAASCPGGVTVVVVPLVSLQGDMLDRCQKLNISCAEWRSDRAPGNVSIVFTTPESAMTKRFQDYIESLRVTARLDRFVIDEGHTILEGTRAFRPKLRELGGLALIGVQMVYLTATLPPTREDALFSLINTRREDVVMIRMRTTRTNVAYSVRSIPAASAGEATAAVVLTAREIVDQKLEEYPWPAKVIIYCQRVEATEALAEEFGCDAYHREVDTRDGKAERLRVWMSGLRRDQYGDGRVIVATNALGLGIDVADIRVVLHIEMPFEMADYAQQSGRAGRDGLRSEAIIVRVDIKGVPGRQRPLVVEDAATDDYISGRACRRVVMDSVMDGRTDRHGCEEGEELCDICQARSEAVDLEELGISEDEEEAGIRMRELDVQAARGRAITHGMKEQEEFREFRQRLQERGLDGCIFCWSRGIGDRVHSGVQCTRILDMDEKRRAAFGVAVQMDRFLRRNKVMEDFGYCLGCFVPQELCDAWEEDIVEGGWQKIRGRGCQYEGVMVSTIAYVGTCIPDDADLLYERLGFRGTFGGGMSMKERSEQVWRWMGKRVLWAGVDVSNICRVFMYMAEPEE